MPARKDRRRTPRKRKVARIKISIWQNAENLVTIVVTAVDVSKGGLGLACPIPLTRGEYFVLATSKEKYLYRVVRCWPAGGAYRVGAVRELKVGVEADRSHLNQIKKLLTLAFEAPPSRAPAPAAAAISIF